MPTPTPARRTVLLAGLASLAGCTSSPPVKPPSSPATVSPKPQPSGPEPPPTSGSWGTGVMSFNMLTSIRTASDLNPGVPAADVTLARRAPSMAAWIEAAGPDVIGLQENEANSPAELPLRALGPLLPGYSQVQADLEVPILVREAAYIVGDSGAVVLSRKFYVRYLSWCWLTNRKTGGRLLVANTHLDPFQRLPQARARSAQVDLLIARLQKLNPDWQVPTVLLGDFNTRSDETRGVYRDALVKLPAAGLRNSARIAARSVSAVPGAASKNDFGAEIGGRWHYRAIRTDGMCYDYAFVSSQVAVRTWQVVTGPGVRRISGHPYFAAAPVPSDHCPVQAELTIRTG